MTAKPNTHPSSPPKVDDEKKERPARFVKIGSVQVAIWRNLTKEGREVFNATFERLYFDEQADKWDSSTSFGRRDMLELSKAADIAHTVMSELHENANRRVAARSASDTAKAAR